jgi:hypothetical protein
VGRAARELYFGEAQLSQDSGGLVDGVVEVPCHDEVGRLLQELLCAFAQTLQLAVCVEQGQAGSDVGRDQAVLPPIESVEV